MTTEDNNDREIIYFTRVKLSVSRKHHSRTFRPGVVLARRHNERQQRRSRSGPGRRGKQRKLLLRRKERRRRQARDLQPVQRSRQR